MGGPRRVGRHQGTGTANRHGEQGAAERAAHPLQVITRVVASRSPARWMSVAGRTLLA
ncbi:hypothetical protein [Microbispora sp. NPDC046933]|uniref:hypothetical protein n=1 Tax=Microbispora sp. NPDC046933 TaxID=3155618 RepID=UPI00340DB441